jgi:outer membrane protein TolC
LYPAFSINGTLGVEATDVTKLFNAQSLTGSIGPTFQWNILNYGRLVNNVRYQDAKFQELVAAYQQTALQADEEVEDGLVTFLRAQDRTDHLNRCVDAATASVKDIFLPTALGRAGFDFSRFALIEQNKVTQQDLLSQARGQIALGLIQVYRALGGGWELRNEPLEVLPPVETLPSVPPEGEAELQKLRDLLSPQTVPPANQAMPLPPAAPAQP